MRIYSAFPAFTYMAIPSSHLRYLKISSMEPKNLIAALLHRFLENRSQPSGIVTAETE